VDNSQNVPSIKQGWLQRWSDVALHPRKFFTTSGREFRESPFQFFVLNQLVAYILLIIVSIAFFCIYWRANLLVRVRYDLADDLRGAAFLFLVYIVLNFVVAFVAALFSWIVARLGGTSTAFPPHLRTSLEVSAFEPVVAPAFGFLFLVGLEYSTVRLFLSGVMILAGRGWAAWAGYWAMRGLHAFPPLKQGLLYIFGFFIPQITLTSLCLALLWMLIFMIFVPTWD
jgi:hypothetical protein